MFLSAAFLTQSVGIFCFIIGFPGGSDGKESAYQGRRCKRRGFDSWVRKIPWRRKWQSTPVFLPGRSHGQRSLVGYSPRGHKESNTTERLHIHIQYYIGFPGGSDGKASVYNAGDPGSIPESGRSPGEGNGNPLQYYCLENPMDRGVW